MNILKFLLKYLFLKYLCNKYIYFRKKYISWLYYNEIKKQYGRIRKNNI